MLIWCPQLLSSVCHRGIMKVGKVLLPSPPIDEKKKIKAKKSESFSHTSKIVFRKEVSYFCLLSMHMSEDICMLRRKLVKGNEAVRTEGKTRGRDSQVIPLLRHLCPS